jgi:hypothetical protein
MKHGEVSSSDFAVDIDVIISDDDIYQAYLTLLYRYKEKTHSTDQYRQLLELAHWRRYGKMLKHHITPLWGAN